LEKFLKNLPIVVFIFFWSIAPNPSSGGEKMEIASSAFTDGGKIPIRYIMVAAGGKNLSIPFSWKNAPPETKSFALSIIDPHPVAQNWVHWLVVNIPGATISLPEGASGKSMPKGSVELKNSFGDIGYGGPQPPKGSGEHPYVITLYALNVEKLDLTANASWSLFKKVLEGKVLQSANTTGKYER
jgi:Raf kinase inhibitor-like YbhB/YbcL family protein